MQLLRRDDIIELETKYIVELERIENNISILKFQFAEDSKKGVSKQEYEQQERMFTAERARVSSILNNIEVGKKLLEDYSALVDAKDLTKALIKTTTKRRRESGFELEDFNWEVIRNKYQKNHPYVVIEGVTYIPIGEKV